jgi:hypothetical protein
MKSEGRAQQRILTRPGRFAIPVLLCAAFVGQGRAADKSSPPATPGWDRQAAARYLDSREDWWQGWDRAQKDHETLCVSCHTQAPYALARPALRADLGESDISAAEKIMLASIEKRVRSWNQMLPFYSDERYGAGKEVESRAAESVLNATILLSYDTRRGRLSQTARMALANAWTLQLQSGPEAGAWTWQDFAYAPWESKESQYHWAALMAVAVAKAPDNYRDDPQVAGNLAALRAYLSRNFAAQPLLNKTVALWASASVPGLLSDADRNAALGALYTLQRPDGGWSLTDLGIWQRRDQTPLESRPDGYATGLAVLVLEQGAAADPRAREHIARGIHWLKANQDPATGGWPAWSLNKKRDPKSEAGPFMSDAATSYAVLALEAQQ